MSGAKLVRKIVIQCKLKTQSPMRIGSGANYGLTDILILKDKQGRPFIPGTSLAVCYATKLRQFTAKQLQISCSGRLTDAMLTRVC